MVSRAQEMTVKFIVMHSMPSCIMASMTALYPLTASNFMAIISMCWMRPSLENFRRSSFFFLLSSSWDFRSARISSVSSLISFSTEMMLSSDISFSFPLDGIKFGLDDLVDDLVRMLS